MEFMFKKRGYRLFRCPKCGLVSTELGLEYEKFVRVFYQKGYFTGDESCGAYAQYEDDKRFITRNMEHHLEVIRNLKPSGKLLDIGCAMGFFMEMTREAGYDTYGFDASKYAVNHAPQFMAGQIKTGTIGSVSYPKNSFDIISMLDVFEHLNDPVRDLKRIRGWLKSDGLLLITTGDTKSISAKILNKHWTFYTPPQHLMFYHKKGITEVLEKSGLEPIYWYRIGKWLSLSYIMHLAVTSADWPILKGMYNIIRKLRLDSIPLYLPMYDNIAVIARKKL
jgi:SAM-dependent methyltransferase